MSEERWADLGKEMLRKYEKLDEKIDSKLDSLRSEFFAEMRAMREEFSAQLDDYKRETAAGFARVGAQYSDLRQEMLAGFAEMRERIERSQRNTVIMLTSMVVLLLTWLEIRGAVLALFGS